MKELKTQSGKNILIYDDLFTMAQRQEFYDYAKNCYFKISATDNTNIEYQSDRSLVSTLNLSDINNLGFFKAIKDEKLDQIFKEHILESCIVNLSTPADIYHIHTDINLKKGITLLYYINMNWNIEWAGETLFFDDNGTEIEFISAYKPGRIVLFDGDIPHMIRPATFKSNLHRMTLACKFLHKSHW